MPDQFIDDEDARRRLSEWARLRVEPAWDPAEIDAACQRAEARMSHMGPEARRGSLLTLAKPAPSHKRDWREDRSTRVELRRVQGGWELANLRRGALATSPVALLRSAPLDLIDAGDHKDDADCSKRLVWLIESGELPIEAGLPGTEIDSLRSETLSALAHCAGRSAHKWIDKLLSMGANPSGRSAYGKTPLHMCAGAAFHPQAALCARALLAAGADPLARTRSGKTPSAFLDYRSKDTPAGKLIAAAHAPAAARALEAKRLAACAPEPAAQGPRLRL